MPAIPNHLTGATIHVYAALADEGWRTAAEAADDAHLSKQYTTRLLADLVAEGIAVTRVDPADPVKRRRQWRLA